MIYWKLNDLWIINDNIIIKIYALFVKIIWIILKKQIFMKLIDFNNEIYFSIEMRF
jgi:hypothetical protein